MLLLFRIDYRLSYLSVWIGRIPEYVKRGYVANYKPFLDPSTVPQIVQQSVRNVEGKACSVTRFSQKLDSEADAERVTKMFVSDPRMPVFLRMMASRKTNRGRRIMEMTESSHPVFYLGTLNDRCLMVGIVMYEPYEKVRTGSFYFDSTYIGDEFKQIMTKETEKLRGVMDGVSVAVEDILRVREHTGAE